MKNLLLGALLGAGIAAAVAVYDTKSTFVSGQEDACNHIISSMTGGAAKCVVDNKQVFVQLGDQRFTLDGQAVTK